MRRKREEWPELLAQWQASGESAAEFAGRIGTGAATLYRWRRVFRRTTARRHAAPAVARLVEVRPTVIVADGRFEVRLADGRCVGVPPSFDPDALGRLLQVLEATR